MGGAITMDAKIYLDEQGNPLPARGVSAVPVYLDQNGKPEKSAPAKPPKESFMRSAAESLHRWNPADPTSDLNVGGLKGMGHTIAGVSKLINKIPFVGEDLAPQEGINALDKVTAPQGVAEKTGHFMEQTGEFLLPGPGEEKLGLMAAENFPKIAAASKLAIPAMRTGYQGLKGAFVGGLHGEDPVKAGLSNAGGTAIGEASAAAIPYIGKILRSSAESQYGKFLNPTKEPMKNAAEKVIPQLLDRNVLAVSGRGLENRAAANAGVLGRKIDQAVSSVPPSVKPDAQGVIDSLEKYKQGFMTNGVAVNESAVQHADRLKNMVLDLATQPNQPLSYQSLNKARQILDANVAHSGAYFGKTLAEGSSLDAEREAANAIRTELSRQSPDIHKLNAEFSFWRNVQDVIGETNARKVGQQGGMGKIFAPMIGAGAGLARGGLSVHGTAEAALGATALATINAAVKSPAWRTFSAVQKSSVASLLASGKVDEAVKVLSRVAAVAPGEMQR